jgi:hypothetical protein
MIVLDDNVVDLNAILNPASVYDHPRDVVANSILSIGKKRAMSDSWASDAAAAASSLALRQIPGSRRVVRVEEVLDALSTLDTTPKGPPGGKAARINSTARVGVAA